MPLSDLKLKKIYRTKQDNISDLLIIPALKESNKYDRGSGYFTLASLAGLADGLIPFIQHGGTIRVVSSVQLSEDDVAAIKKGLEINAEVVETKIHERIEEDIKDEESLLKLDFITNLIAAEILAIKIAYLPDGIYHEKIGILSDKVGGKIYFSGSNNATVAGLNKNWESVMLLTSWWGENELIEEQQEYFNNLWNNELQGLEVMSFPEAEKKNLIHKYKVSVDVKSAIEKIQKKKIRRPGNKELYDYQKTAISQFMNNKGNHFFEMATGTGKTITAVKAVVALSQQERILSVIVLVPQIDLQIQWKKAFDDEGIKSLFLGGYANANETKYNFGSFIINSSSEDGINVAIATYDTFFSKFIKQCSTVGSQALIVVDEAHNLSPNQIRMLPEYFRFRLGLSATPERYSQTETDKIVSYFTRNQSDTYKYTIDEAIEKGFLSHYMYSPIFVHLTDIEFERYQNYTKQVIVALNQEPRDEEQITDILTKRSNVVKKSSSKVAKLKEIVSGQAETKYDFKNSVVYCGQGKDYETEESIINSVTKILSKDGHYSVSQFTAHTVDRARVLREFEDENYDVLVAIKCFDEGVDVPKLDKIYIMASDGLNRQTIQRRGRVLRTCTDSGKRMAYIYDFVALPPIGRSEGIGVSTLVINEMRRAREYARLADNKTDIMDGMQSIMQMYGVHMEDLDNEFDAESE